MKSKFIFIVLMICAVTAFASNSPYQGEQLRAIKALSEGEISSLLNGQGMGFAKAAELMTALRASPGGPELLAAEAGPT